VDKKVIQSITKKHKTRINNICQGCGRKRELESAHIKGKERKRIIERVLARYIVDKKLGIVKVDLKEAEEAIIKAHQPIEKYSKFLCAECHKRYDDTGRV